MDEAREKIDGIVENLDHPTEDEPQPVTTLTNDNGELTTVTTEVAFVFYLENMVVFRNLSTRELRQ